MLCSNPDDINDDEIREKVKMVKEGGDIIAMCEVLDEVVMAERRAARAKLAKKNRELKRKDVALKSKDDALKIKDEELKRKDEEAKKMLAEKDNEIREIIARKDEELKRLNERVKRMEQGKVFSSGS